MSTIYLFTVPLLTHSTWVWVFTQTYNIPFVFSTWVWIFTQTYNIRILYENVLDTYNIRIHNVLSPSQVWLKKVWPHYHFPSDPSCDIDHRRLLLFSLRPFMWHWPSLPFTFISPWTFIVPFSLRTRLHIIYIHTQGYKFYMRVLLHTYNRLCILLLARVYFICSQVNMNVKCSFVCQKSYCLPPLPHIYTKV